MGHKWEWVFSLNGWAPLFTWIGNFTVHNTVSKYGATIFIIIQFISFAIFPSRDPVLQITVRNVEVIILYHSTIFRDFKLSEATATTGLQIKYWHFCSSMISYVINILQRGHKKRMLLKQGHNFHNHI